MKDIVSYTDKNIIKVDDKRNRKEIEEVKVFLNDKASSLDEESRNLGNN